MKHRLPRTPAEWLKEIREAIADARETNRLGGRMGEPDTDDDLFLLAPLACLKFRGRELKGPEATRVTKAALAAYAVNSSPEGIDRGLKTSPRRPLPRRPASTGPTSARSSWARCKSVSALH